MYAAYCDKQPTNDNAMQRHTYSRVHIDIRIQVSPFTHSRPLLLGNHQHAHGPAFQLSTVQRGFDGVMKVLLFIIHSPVCL